MHSHHWYYFQHTKSAGRYQEKRCDPGPCFVQSFVLDMFHAFAAFYVFSAMLFILYFSTGTICVLSLELLRLLLHAAMLVQMYLAGL